MLNRGLTASEDRYDWLGLHGKDDSALLASIASIKMVKTLCSSHQYFSWDYFLTFTCNLKMHFWTVPIRSWIGNKGWRKSRL